MNTPKLFILLLALLSFASFANAQDVESLPKVSIETVEAEVPKAIVVAEPVAEPVVLEAVDSAVIPDGVEVIVLSAFTNLVNKHAWLATLIIFMGMCRVFAKPVFSAIHALIDMTPSKTDDGFLNSALVFFNTNPLGKTLAFGIDWLTSIKIKAPTPHDK